MKCEIEFMAVGEGSRAGDAIIIRYGEPEAFQLMLVDGGTTETGEQIVKDLQTRFPHNLRLEHVVLTHADGDHSSGLREVLKSIPVQNLWLYVPWMHAEAALHLFKGNRTAEQLAASIKKEYDILSEIIDLARQAGCTIRCPEQGAQIGPFQVLSPRRATYNYLLPQFEKTPEPNQEVLEQANIWIGKPTYLSKVLEALYAKAEKWIQETWYYERLRDGGRTSASNESSVILYANLESQRILLTGDAGVNALTWAADHANENNLPLQNFTFVQIPHHGSRRNVGPTILNRLIGPIQPEGTHRGVAYVSAPKDDESHPRKIVLNAFMRRGYKVFATQGSNKVHRGGFPSRPGYVASENMEFSSTVEEYD